MRDIFRILQAVRLSSSIPFKRVWNDLTLRGYRSWAHRNMRRLLVCLLACFIVVSASPIVYGQGAEPSGKGGQQPMEVIHPKVRGFALQKVGSRYEPVLHYDKAFRLPGTNMRFGSYTYFIPEDEELGVPKWGFLLDNGRFFYVNELYASAGEAQYALSGDYFVVDGGSGGSGNCRAMYLFQYDKNSAKLIDRIEETHEVYAPPAFYSDYPGKPAYGHELVSRDFEDVPVWIISEKDREGHPLIEMEMVRDLPGTVLGPKEFEVFHIYLRIVKGRLRVALDPYLYETLFRSLGEAGGTPFPVCRVLRLGFPLEEADPRRHKSRACRKQGPAMARGYLKVRQQMGLCAPQAIWASIARDRRIQT